MTMKEIKAFLHRIRIADVIHALKTAGFEHFTVIDVKGTLPALDPMEQDYSLEIGERVTSEVKLELLCPDDEVERAISVIRDHARTGRRVAGWIQVSPVERLVLLGDPRTPARQSPGDPEKNG